MILIFSPFAAIQQHREIEIKLALKLSSDESVEFLSCDGLFNSFCVAMSAFGMTERAHQLEKEKACDACKRLNHMTQDFLTFKVNQGSDYLTKDDDKAIAELMREITKENWFSFTYMNVPVGKFASYEFLLNHKLNSLQIPDDLWTFFLSHLGNCIKAVDLAKSYFSTNKPSKVITYNRMYSINRIFCYIAEQSGVPTFSIQAAGPLNKYYSRISCIREDQEIFLWSRSKAWRIYNGMPLNLLTVLRAYRHLRSLFAANSPWVYSSPKKGLGSEHLLSTLGVRPGQRVLLLTTSSEDELFSARVNGIIDQDAGTSLFTSNLEWIEAVTREIASLEDYFLIIRPHPREFPNKREKVMSVSGANLVVALESYRSRDNIFVNTPDQEISIYDLARISSLHLNATSTVGLEMALLGVPSLTFCPDRLTAYPVDIGFSATSNSEYFNYLFSDSVEVSKEQLSTAMRWINFRYFGSTYPSGNILVNIQYFVANFTRRVGSRLKVALISGILSFFTRYVSRARFSLPGNKIEATVTKDKIRSYIPKFTRSLVESIALSTYRALVRKFK